MARKFQDISQLYKENIAEISSKEEHWKNFLSVACKFYKYSFPDQVLIYAQRPDATACASYEFWNSKMYRYVNKGAKGIALIDDSGQWSRLKYVFDISDTHAARGVPNPYLWEMKPDFEQNIREAFIANIGEVEEKQNNDFSDFIKSISDMAVTDNIVDYMEQFENIENWGLLESFPQESKNIFFDALVKESVFYTVSKRLGIDIEDNNKYIQNLNLVTIFNSAETLIETGTAVSDISEIVLRYAERAIKQIENPYVFDYREFFAENSKWLHNDDENRNKIETERSSRYESDLQSDRDLSYTQYTNEHTKTADGQIRNDEKNISEGTQKGSLQPNADDGNIKSAPFRNRQTGEGTVGSNNEEAAISRERTRQGQKLTGVDTVPKQLTLESGGIYNANDLQINDENEKTEDLKSSAFFMPEEVHTEPKKEIYIEPVNFKITDTDLGKGGAKTKAQNNINAIKLLQTLENENRNATPDEQEILSKYVGWGGIPQAFDRNNSNWTKEYDEIKNLLTETEYEKARESTLTAFYTSPLVCRSIYKVIENMGFKTGNILEPSMGVGNFFGILPESMKDSKLYGVELDSISGRIAKKLYPKANIIIDGFENTNFPDSFFDVAIGNIPFGNFHINDERYNKYKFNIHDYFIAKAIDKVRAGGVIAFVTSKGTLDKKDNTVRKYIAQRAELLGAIRLPNTAFYANANTEVTSDILFFQKRERIIANAEPEWINLGTTQDGVPVNKYFEINPQMVLGRMVFDKSMYGNEADTACEPYTESSLEELLNNAINNIKGTIPEIDMDFDIGDEEEIKTIPADANVRNFSFTIVENEIYFRENSIMRNVTSSETGEKRIRGMIEVRDCVRELISEQLNGCDDFTLKKIQTKLNSLYDKYTSKYGLMNSRGNSMAFSDDSGYPLLCSLEILNDDKTLKKKADIFTKRTIKPYSKVEKVNTPQEALAASIGERACVDLDYMSGLLEEMPKERIISELKGQIFENPSTGKWKTADEYLSGDVKQKLKAALYYANTEPERFNLNVEALKEIQPKDLSAAEISVGLGATWIPQDIINNFMYETLKTPEYLKKDIKVYYSPISAVWSVSGKRRDSPNNVVVNTTYGTTRINGYEILQESLNMKDVKIFDTVKDENGNEKRVLNAKETTLAQQKQESLKQTFKNWIYKDSYRRERLVRLYNDTFNNIVPRQYNGDNIRFQGINPEISLRPHQKNAVARIIYGGNTLLAHCVGAGKTFEMTAAAMELKRLGLCNKSMFVVPSHLTEQWAGEFLQLYPAANILVATKKDFETSRRKKFCSRIATGEYDAVIIGQSQLEKIPVLKERQEEFINEQINEIILGIEQLKREKGDNFAIKQMELTKKKLKERLEKIKDEKRKDNVINFEELGVDRIFVDEAHYYKNLFLYTKMRNVAGISQTEAKKSSDLYVKCRYLDELTSNKGVIFATGTPVSNSMTELYTMMRYLQNDLLEKKRTKTF